MITREGFASPVSLLRVTQSGIGARYARSPSDNLPRRFPSSRRNRGRNDFADFVSLFIGRKLFALESFLPLRGRGNDGVN